MGCISYAFTRVTVSSGLLTVLQLDPVTLITGDSVCKACVEKVLNPVNAGTWAENAAPSQVCYVCACLFNWRRFLRFLP